MPQKEEEIFEVITRYALFLLISIGILWSFNLISITAQGYTIFIASLIIAAVYQIVYRWL